MKYKINDKVKIRDDLMGTIKHIGEVKGKNGKWIGLELSKPEGRNNGVYDGVKYFDCRPQHGIFVKLVKTEIEKKNSEIEKKNSDSILDSFTNYFWTKNSAPDDTIDASQVLSMVSRCKATLKNTSKEPGIPAVNIRRGNPPPNNCNQSMRGNNISREFSREFNPNQSLFENDNDSEIATEAPPNGPIDAQRQEIYSDMQRHEISSDMQRHEIYREENQILKKQNKIYKILLNSLMAKAIENIKAVSEKLKTVDSKLAGMRRFHVPFEEKSKVVSLVCRIIRAEATSENDYQEFKSIMQKYNIAV